MAAALATIDKPYSDEELLGLVGEEYARSVGFDNKTELLQDREKALEYRKGQMDDVASLPNRSTAVSTDVDEAIEAVLPDLVDILTGGEDVATFRPRGEEDVEAARQETDYLNHVLFNENDGFMVIYTMIKDALQVKTGVVTWYDEEQPDLEPDEYRGITAEGMALTEAEHGELVDVRPSEQKAEGGELFDFEIPKPKPRNKVCVRPVPPEDFAVAADTVRLRDATYCAMRYRPRAQDLIAQGVDPNIVDSLPAYGTSNQSIELARDTAGEHENGFDAGGVGDLRLVEVVAHYIRLYEEGEMRIYRVRTGGSQRVFIDKERVDAIQFAAITPFVVTHRFYGESLADKVMEIQRIKTALTRISLDSAYFALNQRHQVDMTKSNQFTLMDLLNNQPGSPVRTNGDAVSPLTAAPLNFDPFRSLEYFNTVSEQRTGVVRNAQGMNPDTLHDTAKGALVLMGAAKKRIRLIARIFAETGIKDMMLGIHALLRQGGGMAERIRLRNEWVEIDPTSWGERNDMSIEIGVGSSGREQDLAVMQQIINLQEKAVEAQGGIEGPLVTKENLYNSAIRYAEKAGIKMPELFFSAPSQTPPQPQEQPAPDPVAMAKAQADMQRVQIDQAKLALEDRKTQQDGEMAVATYQIEARKLALEEARLQLDAQSKAIEEQRLSRQQEIDAALEEKRIDSDAAVKMAGINAEYNKTITAETIRADTETMRAQTDLAIQASEAQHGKEMHLANVVDEVLKAANADEPLTPPDLGDE